jgi:WD40 repeat protein
MVQDETGYTNDHVAATFHASHYYNLVGEPTPKARQMVDRILRDQRPDGSWLLNMPSRDRHATFDAVFTLLHEGSGRPDCRAAIQRAARWALCCRNPDGGFGHFPGSTSDADAVYFQVGTLVMAGFLKPADPLPPDPQLLSWGHLMPVRKPSANDPVRLDVGSWVGAVAFSHDGQLLATGSADGLARTWGVASGKPLVTFKGHTDHVAAVAFAPDDALLATGSHDRTVRVWDAKTGRLLHTLSGHRGALKSVAFAPAPRDPPLLASASVDGTIRLWDARTGQPRRTLEAHKSWVNSIAFAQGGATLVSGSSDGTVKLWDVATGDCRKTIPASKAEVRCVAISPDGGLIAAGLRYGSIKVWNTADWSERPFITGLPGDVWSLAFTPAGQLLSGSGDWNLPGQVTLWDPVTGKQIKQLNHTGEVLSIAISPKAQRIAAGGGDGTVTIWAEATLRPGD